jgi:hypothetical protein
MEKLTFYFNVCIALGLVLPLLDLALGFLGSLLDFDFDIGGHHMGDVFGSGGDAGGDGNVLPFNIMCLCFGLVVFGALGRLSERLMVSAWAIAGTLIGLLGLAFLAYWLVFRFIVKPLKKSSPTAICQWDLLSAKGKLTLRNTKDSPGMVSLLDSTGARISYRPWQRRRCSAYGRARSRRAPSDRNGCRRKTKACICEARFHAGKYEPEANSPWSRQNP